jgi:hypothetical protein
MQQKMFLQISRARSFIIIMNNYEHQQRPECTALCGNKATGLLKLTSDASIFVCEACRELIDKNHEHEFIPFDT